MFPALIAHTDPDELLRCRESHLFSDRQSQERDQISSADTALADEAEALAGDYFALPPDKRGKMLRMPLDRRAKKMFGLPWKMIASATTGPT